MVPAPMADTNEGPEFELPRRFGRYVLFDHIGRGGMAEIYLARGTTQMGASRLAVVKVVLNRFSEDPSFAAMLISEAKLAARLSHRNIVQTFDLGREEGRLFIAMQYVEGFDVTQLLRKLSQKKIGLPAEFGFYIVLEMLQALDYAHRCTDDDGNALGIVHRDVSPSNVLVSLEGEVKLCDFGIARAVTDIAELPEGALEGKAAYMSPEQACGERIDGRADIFSASIILWELLCGRRMYKAQPGREVIDIARAGEVPPLVDRGLPEYAQLQAIVSKGLAPRREDRYATAGAMARDLEDYVIRNRLRASPMKLGGFLTEQFETELVSVRRDLEQRALSVTAEVSVEVIPDLGGFDDDRAPLLTVPPAAVPEEIPPLALPSSGPPGPLEVSIPTAVLPDAPRPVAPAPPAKRPVAVIALAAVVVVGVLAFAASQLLH
jgi:serine/threonine protein kinase